MKQGCRRIWIDNELIEILDGMQEKLSEITYNSMDAESYRKLSRILARKIKESGLVY